MRQRLVTSDSTNAKLKQRSVPTSSPGSTLYEANPTRQRSSATDWCDVVVMFNRTSPLARIDAVSEALGKAAVSDLTVRRHITRTGVQLLLVSAKHGSLTKWAELTALPKELSNEMGGLCREFTRQNAMLFRGYAENPHDFFTVKERQALANCILNNVRLSAQQISGSEALGCLQLLETQPLVPRCMSQGLISQVFPLHENEGLASLDRLWVRSFFSRQPIDAIAGYFGIKLGIYFAWLGHYTFSLIVPTIIGIAYWLRSFGSRTDLDDDVAFVLFALFNIIWSTLFLESWKRRCAAIAYRWGTLDYREDLMEEPRPTFKGYVGQSEITGKSELMYPEWKRLLKQYLVGWPVVLSCIAGDIFVMWTLLELQFWWERHTDDHNLGKWSNYLPKLLLVFTVGVFENLYKKVAIFLNDFENYRLEETYQNNLIVKLALFQFVNSFASLFYIAFYLQDMTRLKKQLAALLIVRQVVGNVKESLIPFIKGRIKLAKMNKQPLIKVVSGVWQRSTDQEYLVENKDKPAMADDSASIDNEDLDSDPVRQGDALLLKAETQAAMPQYEGTFEDYLEMFIQFGYVILFSSAFPLAALCAWLNNIVEIRSDAFKMCSIFQRPFSQRSRDIGTWQSAMEVMGVIGVMVNCTLIGMSDTVQRWLPGVSTTHRVLVVVLLEHLLILLKIMLDKVIPDIPVWVQVELEKAEYGRREALRTSPLSSESTPLTSTQSTPTRQKCGGEWIPHSTPTSKSVSPRQAAHSTSVADNSNDASSLKHQTPTALSFILSPQLERKSTGTQYVQPLIPQSSKRAAANVFFHSRDGDRRPSRRYSSQSPRSSIQLTVDSPAGRRRILADTAQLSGCVDSVRVSKVRVPKTKRSVLDDISGSDVSQATTSTISSGPSSLGSIDPTPANDLSQSDADDDLELSVAGAEATSSTLRDEERTSPQTARPRRGLLQRTRSLSHVLLLRTTTMNRRQKERPTTAEKITESDVIMPSLPSGELSFLRPSQIIQMGRVSDASAEQS